MNCAKARWYRLAVEVGHNAQAEVSQLLFEMGVSGLEQRCTAGGVELLVYSESRSLMEDMGRAVQEVPILGTKIRAASVRAVDDESWALSWTEYLDSQPLGEECELVPTTAAVRFGGTRRTILYQPQLAFGDGGHPTTQMAAAAVERVCRERRVGRFLDVGAGNGVLSFVAYFSGAESVLGLEIDDCSLRACRKNAGLNSVDPRRCEFSSSSLESLSGSYDLMVGNLELRPLLELIPQMLPLLAEGGQCLLTGFLEEAEQSVAAQLDLAGAEVAERQMLRGWVLLRVVRRGAQ